MIEVIHRHPIVIKILLTIVTVSFVGTGGWMMATSNKSDDYAAKVNGEVVPMKEYQDAYARMEEMYRNVYQGKVPEDLIKKLDLGGKALQGLIDKRLIMEAAEKQGLTVSDSDVNDTIHANSSFQKGGKFDMDVYRKVLQVNGLSPEGYERSLRESLTVEKFRNMIKDSVHVTEDDVREYYASQQKAQNKPFDEADYKAKRDELARTLKLLTQEKAANSFMEGLRKNAKVEKNPNVGSAEPTEGPA